jgi:hypothetical protein
MNVAHRSASKETCALREDFIFSDKRQIGREILSYLYTHRVARDTLEGIVEWWLLERKIVYQREKIKEAVSDLVSKNFIIEDKKIASGRSYRINEDKFEEIKAYLEQSRGKGQGLPQSEQA